MQRQLFHTNLRRATMVGLLLLAAACQRKLVENPQSILTPAFFKTAQGFQTGLDAAYAGNRNIWGPVDYATMSVPGTDEFITGNDGNNDINKYNSNYTSSTGTLSNVWTPCYTYINTCNGLVDNAVSVTGLDTATRNEMVGEARFLRANYYFLLVQQWGNITLNEHFQSTPTTSAAQSPMADVYAFIIQDLRAAIAVLPPSPQTTGVLAGKATKAAAMHLLSKVYLTRGWSPAAQAGDFTHAFQVADSVIHVLGPANGVYLLQDFGQVYAEGNEANNEVLWSVQHTTNLAYNGSATQNNSGPDNLYCHFWVPKYEVEPGMQRSTLYGRPYIRWVPTLWLMDTAFADKVNDTRYAKSFQNLWLCNFAGSIPVWTSPLPPGAPANAVVGQPKFTLNDTAIFMPGYDVSNAQIAASRYLLIPPRKYSIALSPAMTKYFDINRSNMNAPSIRPIIIYRLAETYLIAAEALLMSGQAAAAVPYINAIRERAAYPTGNAAAMDITAGQVTLDFILDERARELCGEVTRWEDLRRTRTLLQRVQLHNSDGRFTITARDTLRPIPQVQIDATITGPAYTQNPGW
ncbi:RagB/SusD family nutrient uptake outer membrane protein [Dinghuibacter silviterrae]|uniref:Putative outer membrane starch-binding protein n=1 Tax=Dinghuibacter silviterrae TaxID=1539049 RepID=A0A4R8DS67_9BACT|nr:RagB/SusD family nutrient uptake outer membrane protein [Dinghuibacter silviterrae]TDX01102.1 putative outer membrane starch-binding protein [Dinghuibacter silviterrae]